MSRNSQNNLKKTDSDQEVLYIRIDKLTALALDVACFKVGAKKTPFILRMLRRELGVPDPEPGPKEPTAAPAVGIKEVSPDDGGKAEAPVSTPEPKLSTSQPQLPACLPGIDAAPVATKVAKVKRELAFKLPSDFRQTPELFEYADSIGVLQPANELEQFCDYHIARGSRFLDWKAAWRTWCRNSLKYQAKHHPNVTRLTERQRVASQIFGPTPIAGDLFDVTPKRLPV